MFRIFTYVVLAALLVSGCGFTPDVEQAPAIEKSFGFPTGYDETWKAVVAVFAELNIPIDNIDKDSGYINSRETAIPREWIHAPEDTLDYQVRNPHGSFNVFVENAPDGSLVSINARLFATEVRSNIVLGSWEQTKEFPSSGAMEEWFHQLLKERLSP